MHLTRFICAAGWAVALVHRPFVSADAQTAPRPYGITLDEATTAALRDNVDVLVSRSLLDSARADRRASLALPNPVLSATPNSPYQYAATIPIDITPQRFSRMAAARAGTDAAEADVHDTERQTRLAVAKAYFDALFAEARVSAAREHRQAIAQILQSDSMRYRAGDLPERNIARSEIELIRADAEVSRAGIDVHTTRVALQALMGIAHPDSARPVVGSLEYRRLQPTSDSLVHIARSNRADLAATTRRLDQSESQRKAAAFLVVPTPALSYVRQYTAPFDNGHFYSLGLSFELPLLNQYSADRQRAAAGVASARLAARRVSAQVEREVMAADADFQLERSLVERYRDGATKSDRSVEAARYAYSRGASSLLEVLDALQAAQEVRVEYLAALHDYWISVYTLNAAVGTDVFAMSGL